MARRTPREVEIFNFSFLDILGCTVGALLFILMLMNVSPGASSTSAPTASPAPAAPSPGPTPAAPVPTAEELAALRGQADRLQKQLVELVKRLATPVPSPSPSPRVDAQGQKRLREDLEAIRREIAALSVEVAKMRSLAASGPKKEGIAFRIPVLRTTSKQAKGLFFLERQRIHEFPEDYDRELLRVTSGLAARYTLKSSAYGSGVEELKDPDSNLSRKLAQMNPATDYVSVQVRSDSFPTFRDLRQHLWKLGFELNWLPWSMSESITIPLGSSGPSGPGRVQ